MKKQLIITTLIMILSLTSLLGLSYAYFQSEVNGNSNDIRVTSGILNLTFTENNKIYLNSSSPIYDENRYDSSFSAFTINGESTTASGCYGLKLNINKITDNLKSKFLKWELYDENNKTTLSTGTFEDINNNIVLISNKTFSPNTNDSYILYVWLSYDDKIDQTSLLGGSLEAYVSAEASSKVCK